MRLLYLVGLIILVFIARICAATSVSNVLESNISNRSAFRFLRTRNTVVEAKEERAGAGIFVPVVEKLKTVFTSSKITPEKLQSWLNKEKSADIVFTRMHLTKADSLLFYYPEFSKRIQYVDDLRDKTSKKGISAISTLTTQYGDNELYKMIEGAKIISHTKTLATRLESEQLQHWIMTRKDPDEIIRVFELDKIVKNANFRLLPIENAMTKMLGSTKFTAWAAYVDDLNAKYPEKSASMIPTLKKYFTEEDLLQMTDSAKRMEGTKSTAIKVEDDLVQYWLNSRKTPDAALAEIGLSKTTNTLLEIPILNVWVKYMDTYNAKYPDKKTTMIETFTRTFDDEQVTKMIVAGKEKDATKDIATKLEIEQLNM